MVLAIFWTCSARRWPVEVADFPGFSTLSYSCRESGLGKAGRVPAEGKRYKEKTMRMASTFAFCKLVNTSPFSNLTARNHGKGLAPRKEFHYVLILKSVKRRVATGSEAKGRTSYAQRVARRLFRE
jgi:hypothetical protein